MGRSNVEGAAGLGWERTSGEFDSGTAVASGRLGFGGRGSVPLPKWRLFVAALPAWCGENVPVKCKRIWFFICSWFFKIFERCAFLKYRSSLKFVHMSVKSTLLGE